jgi:hypothetical protein
VLAWQAPAELLPRVDGARLADDFTIRKAGARKRKGSNKHEGKDLAPCSSRRLVTTKGRLTVIPVICRVSFEGESPRRNRRLCYYSLAFGVFH